MGCRDRHKTYAVPVAGGTDTRRLTSRHREDHDTARLLDAKFSLDECRRVLIVFDPEWADPVVVMCNILAVRYPEKVRFPQPARQWGLTPERAALEVRELLQEDRSSIAIVLSWPNVLEYRQSCVTEVTKVCFDRGREVCAHFLQLARCIPREDVTRHLQDCLFPVGLKGLDVDLSASGEQCEAPIEVLVAALAVSLK